MKEVLILGAGLVAKPAVRYLLDLPDYHVTVASRTVSKAEALISGHERGTAESLNVSDDVALEKAVKDSDLVISLLPWALHMAVAKHCIKHKKHMVTTSYVKEEMEALGPDAEKAGILLLNEIGLDPGIDHMSAMRIIDRVKAEGGKVTSYKSFCAGLPAPEANDNPFGYKFSWTPRGVLLAGKSPGRYMLDGEIIDVSGSDVYANPWKINIEGIGDIEGHINRDAIPYIELCGLEGIRTIFRSALRNIGFCETMKKLVEIGYFNDDEKLDINNKTYKEFTGELSGGPVEGEPGVVERIKWLGLLDDAKIGLEKATPMDVLGDILADKLKYTEGERDMCVLHHRFEVEYPDRKTKILATMILFGDAINDSSMSRSVSLPAAIASKMILENKLNLTGVYIPVVPEIYNPVLNELEELDISLNEIEETM